MRLVLGSAHSPPPAGAGAHYTLERPDERSLIGEAASERNVRHGLAGLLQEIFGPRYTATCEPAMRRLTGGAPKGGRNGLPTACTLQLLRTARCHLPDAPAAFPWRGATATEPSRRECQGK